MGGTVGRTPRREPPQPPQGSGRGCAGRGPLHFLPLLRGQCPDLCRHHDRPRSGVAIDEPEGLDILPLKLKSQTWHWDLIFTQRLFAPASAAQRDPASPSRLRHGDAGADNKIIPPGRHHRRHRARGRQRTALRSWISDGAQGSTLGPSVWQQFFQCHHGVVSDEHLAEAILRRQERNELSTPAAGRIDLARFVHSNHFYDNIVPRRKHRRRCCMLSAEPARRRRVHADSAEHLTILTFQGRSDSAATGTLGQLPRQHDFLGQDNKLVEFHVSNL